MFLLLFLCFAISPVNAVPIEPDQDGFINIRGHDLQIQQGVSVTGYRSGWFGDEPFLATSLTNWDWSESSEQRNVEDCEHEYDANSETFYEVCENKTVTDKTYTAERDFSLRKLKMKQELVVYGDGGKKMTAWFTNNGKDIHNATYWFWFRNADNPQWQKNRSQIRLDYGTFWNYQDVLDQGYYVHDYRNRTQLFGESNIVVIGFKKDDTLASGETAELDPVSASITIGYVTPEYIRFYNATTGTTVDRSLTGDDLFNDDIEVGDKICFSKTAEHNPPAYMRWNISQGLVADAIELNWKYESGSYGGDWIQFYPDDHTNSFQSEGINETNWKYIDNDGIYRYFNFCVEVVSVTNPSEGGAFSNDTDIADGLVTIESGATVTRNDLIDTAQAYNWSNLDWNPSSSWFTGGDTFPNEQRDGRNMVFYSGLKIESGATLQMSSMNLFFWSNIARFGFPRIDVDGTWQLGVESNDFAYDGVSVWTGTTGHPDSGHYMFLDSGGTLKCYNSELRRGTTSDFGTNDGTVYANDCFIEEGYLGWNEGGWSPTIYTSGEGISFSAGRVDIDGSYSKLNILNNPQYFAYCTNFVCTDCNIRTLEFVGGQNDIVDGTLNITVQLRGMGTVNQWIKRNWTFEGFKVFVDGVPESGVRIEGYNRTGQLTHNMTTGANGKTSSFQINQWYYTNNGSIIAPEDAYHQNPYTFNFSKAGYETISLKVNVTGQTEMFIPVALLEEQVEDVTEAGGLTLVPFGGTEYELNEEAKRWFRLTNGTGSAVNNANCSYQIIAEDDTVQDSGEMTHYANGTYYFVSNMSSYGDIAVWGTCEYSGNITNTIDQFHVAEWTGNITDGWQLYIIVALGILAFVFFMLSRKSENTLGLQYLFMGLGILMILALAGFMVAITGTATEGIINGVYTAVSWGIVLFFFFIIIKIITGALDEWRKQ